MYKYSWAKCLRYEVKTDYTARNVTCLIRKLLFSLSSVQLWVWRRCQCYGFLKYSGVKQYRGWDDFRSKGFMQEAPSHWYPTFSDKQVFSAAGWRSWEWQRTYRCAFFNQCKLSYFNGFHDNLLPERGCLWCCLSHTVLCHWLQPQMCVSRPAQQDLFKQAAMFKFTCLLEMSLPILNTLKKKQHPFEAYTSLLFLNLKYTLRLQWR